MLVKDIRLEGTCVAVKSARWGGPGDFVLSRLGGRGGRSYRSIHA